MPDRKRREPERTPDPRPPEKSDPPPDRDPLDDLDEHAERHEENVDRDEPPKE